MSLKWSDLDDKTKARVAAQEPAIRELVKTIPPDSKKSDRRASNQGIKKHGGADGEFHLYGPHVYLFRLCVAILAYALVGTGWLVGAVGDALYELGKRMHDAKWNIR